jgi:hypothetical protein
MWAARIFSAVKTSSSSGCEACQVASQNSGQMFPVICAQLPTEDMPAIKCPVHHEIYTQQGKPVPTSIFFSDWNWTDGLKVEAALGGPRCTSFKNERKNALHLTEKEDWTTFGWLRSGYEACPDGWGDVRKPYCSCCSTCQHSRTRFLEYASISNTEIFLK